MSAPADPVAAWAAADGGFPAVIEDGAVTTRADLNAQVNLMASGMAALGVKAGERGVWCGPNSTQVVIFMHACRKLGLVAVPLPYRFTAEECLHVLADSEAALVIVDAAYAPVIGGIVTRLPKLRHAIAFGGHHPGLLPWDDVTALGSAEEPPPPADYGTAMMYTSGTTGRPKGAIRSRSDRALLGAMMAELHFGSSEVHLVTGPLYHAGRLRPAHPHHRRHADHHAHLRPGRVAPAGGRAPGHVGLRDPYPPQTHDGPTRPDPGHR